MHAPDTLSLVADVGGTNTRVALANGEALLKDTVRKFSNREYPGLDGVLTAYMDQEQVDCAGVAVAIAGPVRDGKGTLTNLDWSVEPEMLARVAKAETVAVVNDLQAQGHAMGLIAPGNLTTVIDGPMAEGGTRLVIGIGTGFNAALVLPTAFGREVPPAEIGHSGLPVRTEEEFRLARFVAQTHGFPEIEEVLSGRGLENVYAWLKSEAGSEDRKSAAEIMGSAETDPVAGDTIRWFVRTMGAVAGNLSLIYLPFGGVSLIGGVARAMAPYFERYGFAETFRDKGRFTTFMNDFNVDLVEDDFAALTGLASHLNGLMQHQGQTSGSE